MFNPRFNPRSKQGPRRLVKRSPNYVPNELILKTVVEARNDELPHYLNVVAGASAATTNFSDASIDGVLQRLDLRTRSIARVFVPRTVISAALPGVGFRTLASSPISAEYQEDEDAYGLSRIYKITLEKDVNVLRVCDELRTSNAVEDARPNFIAEVFQRPSDEFYGYQWGPAIIGCEAGWEIEIGHPDVVLAIVDSGVDLRHEDLASKLKPGEDFVDFQGSGGSRYELLGDYRNRDFEPQDEDGHGTHCAGISAAESNNARGIAGVCWGGKVLPVRVMFRVFDNFEGRETSVGTDVDIDAGIKFAVDAGAHVINLSLGGPDSSYEEVLQYAYDRNVCVLAATGNENSSAPSYPASNPRTLAVGAINSNLNRASFSNYGSAYNQFVMAPGVEIASTYKFLLARNVNGNAVRYRACRTNCKPNSTQWRKATR